MSHATVVRHAGATVRHGRGVKRPEVDIEFDDVQTGRSRPSRSRYVCKKRKSGATVHPPLALPPVITTPVIDLESRTRDQPDRPSPQIPPSSRRLEEPPALGDEINDDATQTLPPYRFRHGGVGGSPIAMEASATYSRKRRLDWDASEENASDADDCASLAKKARTSDASLNIQTSEEPPRDSKPLLSETSQTPSTVSLNLIQGEDDRWPARPATEDNLGISLPSAHTERFTSPSEFLGSSRLSKWQAPRTSLLGPRTSPYLRRSNICPVPRPMSPNLVKDYLIRNMVNDNITRNPYEQSAQWCEDLHAMGLNESMHPSYTCNHEFHPSDPEYDEEWSNETWSDEEWSDSEDTLPTPSDTEHAESSVTIVGAEEQPQANANGTFTFMDWSNCRPPLPFSSHILGIHARLACPWNVVRRAGADSKGSRGNTFIDATQLLPPA